MKRDMNLIRAILLEIEPYDELISSEDIKIEGYSTKQIGYHIRLLVEAGMLVAYDTTNKDNPHSFIVQYITFSGHEFLDSIRSPKVWGKIKDITSTAAVDLSVESIKFVATKVALAFLPIS